MKIKNKKKPYYFVAYQDEHRIAFGEVGNNQEAETGLNNYEVFENKEKWIARVNELANTPNWFQDNYEE